MDKNKLYLIGAVVFIIFMIGMFAQSKIDLFSVTSTYICSAPSGTSLTGCGTRTFSDLSSCQAATLQCNNQQGLSCRNYCTVNQGTCTPSCVGKCGGVSDGCSGTCNTQCGTTCTPSWQTGSWGTCTNSVQTRTVTDSNNCGVTTNKPITTQSCSTPSFDYTWIIVIVIVGGALFFIMKKK